ncbi:FHA domain-containing protein [Halomicronema hongdechloris]|uniref:FHA domain-containing protein n=1 Tax=Halomicronema hongdechloris TaxID=1209493 RepID=UPI0016514DA8|nr:FHA domain-containing protein [Halomicronema hongdechloris]
MTAIDRCEVTSLYIQGVVVGNAIFLTTNLNADHQIQVTGRGTNWLIGRSKQCAISIPHPEIAPFHTTVGYCPSRGFYLVDVGSHIGTWVNRRRLSHLQRRKLHNGDLLDLGKLRVEFFIDIFDQAVVPLADDTYC